MCVHTECYHNVFELRVRFELTMSFRFWFTKPVQSAAMWPQHFYLFVGEVGLEPTRPFGQWFLRPPCLPIPPYSHIVSYFIVVSAGLEPATATLSGWYSNQLKYETICISYFVVKGGFEPTFSTYRYVLYTLSVCLGTSLFLLALMIGFEPMMGFPSVG